MSVMDCWTFESKFTKGNALVDAVDYDGIAKAYRELYESHRQLHNTLVAIQSVLNIRN